MNLHFKDLPLYISPQCDLIHRVFVWRTTVVLESSDGKYQVQEQPVEVLVQTTAPG